ncbi:trypsin-like peptidase domain-containing protein [Chryseobacterium sp. Ch-15]|uniref:Trypsin-like peptidase domain-containing protein n=1 Tax=Chryseobacterium muglaense TaxID=2893752 RepID=A0A9Q3YPZ6_9FLAO|nr:trypsin-like peptidase domain-containing protein [Chryseobacterium muglaense]MBD3904149.1 trypsin-like peptidase domain-containing protein [Chryseobacterium muglaense]MCC9033279.1 trypsin-like peptidase domain-containing protein [Chryseobacterium muglaense]MCM2553774.1 trypsin-like peptidase domain-containing protein [Chryseobacterium muglaense]
MDNEKNESNHEKLDQNQSQQNNNSHSDDFSEPQNPDSENIISENPGNETQVQSAEEIPKETLPVTGKKKKNPYKIAFFSLGGIILLGGASYFGYQYYKNHQVVPIVENICLDTDTKIYDAYKDAVVMVKHRYAFVARIKGKEIQLNIPEASEETLFGTAFFVDKKGNMISNSHVLQPWNSSENSEKISTDASNIRRKIASILTTDIPEDGYETFLASNWGNASSEYNEEGGYHEGDNEEGGGEEFINSNDVAVDSATTSDDIAASIPHKEYVSEDEIEVYMKTVDISVALHNSADVWLPCTIEKISEDQSIDLGVLQLTTKETPNTVVNIISLDNAVSDDQSLRPGEKAVMIGYPLGEDLAQTISGIKVQLYNGQISKESDGTKIQYSVTSTHGASGSPIFNNCGQLIAVNFSGVEKVQGYNFGIIAKKIYAVYPVIAGEVKPSTE